MFDEEEEFYDDYEEMRESVWEWLDNAGYDHDRIVHCRDHPLEIAEMIVNVHGDNFEDVWLIPSDTAVERLSPHVKTWADRQLSDDA